jgi:hypothetical protein
MAYLLDTNVFIEAKNRHYGFDFCPAFWDWIDHARQVTPTGSPGGPHRGMPLPCAPGSPHQRSLGEPRLSPPASTRPVSKSNPLLGGPTGSSCSSWRDNRQLPADRRIFPDAPGSPTTAPLSGTR